MRKVLRLVIVAAVLGVVARGAEGSARRPDRVEAATPVSSFVSPAGTCRIEVLAWQGGSPPRATIAALGRDGVRRTFTARGDAFLPSDVDRIVVIGSPETNAVPGFLSIVDLEGRELLRRRLSGIVSPTLSNDGTHLALVADDGLVEVDLATLSVRRAPLMFPFSVGPDGRLDGVPVHVQERGRRGAPAGGMPGGGRGIAWPLAPDAQHPIGNTYGEFQSYGGEPYLHPGIDVMGSAGDHVYAVAAGVVKAVLTTGGIWHWRVAIADTATSGTSLGYLYAHLAQPTIAVGVGDTVAAGQYLGDVVAWPVYGFNHCHFARIEDTGDVWYGNWLAAGNLHTDIANQTEDEAPFFAPAVGTDLFAFCLNETSVYESPDSLSGAVDIVAHVGDRIASDWIVTPQELRYSIYPQGHPESPVVDDRLAVSFDMALDTYSGGPIDPFLTGLLYKNDATCRTEGDYDVREFYHVITNSNGDDVYDESDAACAWDTSLLPDGPYVVRVVAADAAGNAAADSMVVTTANGNGTGIAQAPGAGPALSRPLPNPSPGASRIVFCLPAPSRAMLIVYTVSGRRLRTLADGWFPPGSHVVEWDGIDEDGRPAASGVYLIRLTTPAGESATKLTLSR